MYKRQHLTVNAGSKIPPQLPFIDTGMTFGKNISNQDAMTDSQVSHAVDYGRIVGRSLASITAVSYTHLTLPTNREV